MNAEYRISYRARSSLRSCWLQLRPARPSESKAGKAEAQQHCHPRARFRNSVPGRDRKGIRTQDVRRCLEESIAPERKSHLRISRIRQDEDDRILTVLVEAQAAHAVDELDPEFRRRKIEDDADERRKIIVLIDGGRIQEIDQEQVGPEIRQRFHEVACSNRSSTDLIWARRSA